MNLNELLELATGYWPSAALCAAVKLDLFQRLARAPQTAHELSQANQWAEPQLTVLLDALAALGILNKSNHTYDIAPSVRVFLCPDHGPSLVDALRFNVDLYSLWGRIDQLIHTGRPVLPPDAHLGRDPQRTEHFVRGMDSRAHFLLPSVVNALSIPPTGKVLDVGAGPGTLALMLANRYPRARLFALDLPPILEVAQTIHTGDPAHQRITWIPADYRTDPVPQDVDAIVFCGALHQEPLEQARILLAKLARALRPGGRLQVVDFFVSPERTEPVFSALFAVQMMLTKEGAHVYAEEEVRVLCQEAGLEEATVQHLNASPYTIVSAQRPCD